MQATATVSRHPVHTILVHFPIAFWVGSFVADLIASFTHSSHDFGAWLALAGCIGAGIAAIPGAIDLFGTVIPKASERVRQIAYSHAGVNVAALGFWIASVLLRPTFATMSDGAWIFSSLGFVFVGIGGYLGGRLVYEFRIGVPELTNLEPPRPRGSTRSGPDQRSGLA